MKTTIKTNCKSKEFYDDMIDALSYLKANETHLKSKQVEYTEYDGYADGCPVYETGICPNCNREFEVESEEHYNYCPSCGQKLKW